MKNIKGRRIVVLLICMSLSLFFTQCNSQQSKENNNINGKPIADSCCNKGKEIDSIKKQNVTLIQSQITCPKCGHKKTETMPTDVCLLKYTCENCGAVLHPKGEDCCVFCTYGDHKCPSKQ